MTGIFLKLLNMSIAASWIVLAVILLRLLLKKAPKWISCLLWGIVALRLVMPFSLESVFSLIPSPEVIPQDIVTSRTPAIQSGIPAVNSAVNPLITQHMPLGENALGQILTAVSAVWAVGVVILLLYSAVTYWGLRRQVRVSLRYQENIYICDDVVSPFILGSIFPKIYIPSGLDGAQLHCVLAHENAHLKRRDHLWKPLGFLLLSIYWFNPLMWLAYILLCRDIESACDEKVIAAMDHAGKQTYLEALVACSAHRRMVMACPVAFGEVSVKTRIKDIIHYRKPAFWISLASVAACLIAALCFLTNPEPCEHIYHSEITVNAACTQMGMETLTCELCRHSYTVQVQPLAHTYGEGVVVKAPTCTETGRLERTCTGCGNVAAEEIAMTAHTYGEGTVIHAPTCIALGDRVVTCTDCGAKQVEAVEMTAHIPGDPIVVTEANCTEQGEVTATCTYCQAVFVAEVLETNDVHDMHNTVIRAATCADPGEGVNTCARCGHSETCTYETLPHNYVAGLYFEANCFQVGHEQEVCTECGDERWYELPIDETNHALINTDINGNRRCYLCNEIVSYGSLDYQTDMWGGIDTPETQSPDDLFPVIKWDLAH